MKKAMIINEIDKEYGWKIVRSLANYERCRVRLLIAGCLVEGALMGFHKHDIRIRGLMILAEPFPKQDLPLPERKKTLGEEVDLYAGLVEGMAIYSAPQKYEKAFVITGNSPRREYGPIPETGVFPSRHLAEETYNVLDSREKANLSIYEVYTYPGIDHVFEDPSDILRYLARQAIIKYAEMGISIISAIGAEGIAFEEAIDILAPLFEDKVPYYYGYAKQKDIQGISTELQSYKEKLKDITAAALHPLLKDGDIVTLTTSLEYLSAGTRGVIVGRSSADYPYVDANFLMPDGTGVTKRIYGRNMSIIKLTYDEDDEFVKSMMPQCRDCGLNTWEVQRCNCCLACKESNRGWASGIGCPQFVQEDEVSRGFRNRIKDVLVPALKDFSEHPELAKALLGVEKIEALSFNEVYDLLKGKDVA